jgi:phospholipase/carboxylesterase
MTRELKFGRRAPVSGKAKSMVVFVHGYGADGADLLGLADVAMNHAADDLNAFLDISLQAEELGPEALILFGFSQGAMMSLHVAPRREVEIAGVVAISGKLMRPGTLAMELKVKPEILLIHGDQDEVVPFGEMQAAGNALVQSGFQVYGHVMQGSGHGIAQDGLQVALSFISDRLAKLAQV